MSRDLVTRWFNKLPTSEQNMPLLIVNGLAYTPRQTLDEVNRGTPVGAQLQVLIEAGKFGTTTLDATTLAKSRLQLSLQSKPQDKVLFVALPSSGVTPKTFTPAQLLQEINAGTKLGQQWINNEQSFMQKLVQVR